MRVLICSFYFPPTGGGGIQRPLKFAERLPEFGIETRVFAPAESKWLHQGELPARIPAEHVFGAPFLGPRARRPAEELYGTYGFERARRRVLLLPRRLLVPDEDVTWALTAVPAIARVVRRERIDVLLTTSPPHSVQLIGAAVKRLTGVRWVADVRDSIVAHPDRRVERAAVRLKERTLRPVARAVARHADAIVTVTPQIASELSGCSPRGPIRVIPNGADFDDFAGLEYRRASRLRITHTGSFFGKRDPRPFLTALAELGDDVIARFVGDFRRADLGWIRAHDLGRKVELIPFAPRRRALELQRDSELLLLLLPDVGDRSHDVPSGKIYEYLAARRPVLAVVPPGGTAADLVRAAGAGTVVAPDDVDGLRNALHDFRERWRHETLVDVDLPAELAQRISRTERVKELAALLATLG